VIEEVAFCPADKLSFDPRPQMAALFVEGFSQWLHFFDKDGTKLAEAFTPAFQLGTFFVAVTPDNRVLAMVGCPDGAPALVLSKKSFISALGPMRGRFAHRMLTKFLIQTEYPFEIKPNMGSIEFVVSDPSIRGQGVTGRLIEYTMQHRRYLEYVLEVASTNTRAVRLYESLGFTEFMRKPASKRSGVGDYLYLRHVGKN
jgi:ribosomal protein S18 acetylase RimI-like enzyme